MKKENLLVEHSIDFIVESSEVITVNEAKDGDDEKVASSAEFLKLTGVFQKGNYPNGNNRIYKTELLVREVERFQARISQGLSMGKVYHPGFFDQGGPSGVTDVSHRITKLWMEGDIVKGELLVFKTISGREVEAITNGGGKIGISSRGYGSMKKYDVVKIEDREYKDVFIVDDNYRLETFDLVLSPSVKTAIMKPVGKHESKEHDDVNIENKEERRVSMTIEELKSLHPELYNKIHDAAIKEGIKEANTLSETVLEARDAKIKSLEEANTALAEENKTITAENKELKDKLTQVETEKRMTDIKVAVKEAVEKSAYKIYFSAADEAFIASRCSTVEAVADEIGAREKVYEQTLEIVKSQGIVNTNSQKSDTSEANSNGGITQDKEAVEANVRNNMRAMAFG